MVVALPSQRREQKRGLMHLQRIVRITIAVTLLLATAAPVAAQQAAPSVEVDPTTVDGPGPVEFTVTGTGWTATPPILLVACTTPASGDLSDLTVEVDCDTSTIEAVTPDAAGNFEVVVTFDVPTGGLILATSDVASNLVLTAITSGAGGSDDADASQELANTGLESGTLAAAAIVLLAAGLMTIATLKRRPS